MAFSSFPVYLDPSNWQQLQDHQQQGNIGSENFQLPPLHPTAAHHVSGGGMSIRPNSIADRARMLKIPQPEGPLNCPRCESTNTKFCYYNNYSLSQPRHFCKTCRRYWTRGGALRNVPVGGGCRRNKKRKSSSSKTTYSAATEKHTVFNPSRSGIPSACPTDNLGHLPQPSQLPSMASLQNLTRFGLENMGTCSKSSGVQRQLEAGYVAADQANMGFQIETDLGRKNCTSTGLPLLAAGFETPTWLYSSLQSESTVDPSIKMIENQDPKLLSSSLIVGESNQFWGGNSWPCLSGLGSSSTSTTHLL